VCNLRCVMCFQTDKSFTKKPFMGMMDMGLYRNVIDQAAEGAAGAISLGSRGEPFLHPGIGEMMKYASDKNTFFDIKINTNATKLSEAQCHEILSSDVNLIALSIDAYEEKTYEEIRVRGKFKEVLNNVKRLRKIRDTQYPQSKAEIRVSGVRFRDDQNEAGFHNFWSEICDTVVYVRAQLRWNTYENTVHPERTRPCDFLWNKLYVWHDGICNPCDEDYKSKLTPGDVTRHSIERIWNGKTLNKMREEHLANRRSNYNPCDRCGV
jgi:radical SAM protein with 4Fe4S-binding SPASM domain